MVTKPCFDGTTLGRNRPQHIGQIFQAELAGIFETLELGVDLDIGLLALNLRFARRRRHAGRTLELHFHASTLRTVVHRLRRVRDGGLR